MGDRQGIDARWFAGEPTGEPTVLAGPHEALGLEARLIASTNGAVYLVVLHGDVDACTTHEGRVALHAALTGGRAGEATATRLLGAEQTNTSFVVEGTTRGAGPSLVKLLRRVAVGTNLDREIPMALTGVGSTAALPVEAWWEVDGWDLAVMTPFLDDAVDGWTVALETEDPGPLGHELGTLLSHLHLDLVRAHGTRAADASDHLDPLAAACERIDRPVPPDLSTALLTMTDHGVRTRIHGDLHLGQLLRSAAAPGSAPGSPGWVAIDFEGEPDRPIEERREWASPVRDLAGLLRSFAYAGATAERPPSWAERARDACTVAYVGPAEMGGLLPSDLDAALRAHLIAKAAYELAFERSHRPDWAWIPERALEEMFAA